MIKMLTSCQSIKGDYREKNQDRVICRVCQKENLIFAVAGVCDGIGSMEMSEQASELVIDGIANWFEGMKEKYCEIPSEDVVADLEETIYELNELVYEKQIKSGIPIGCTLSFIMILNMKYYIFHVGDSRIYVIKSQMNQLTVDETVQKNVNGKIKSFLANYIGKSNKLWMNRRTGDVQIEDIFVIGSDGLFKGTAFEDFDAIRKKLHSPKSIESANEQLINNVQKRGEKDNISCIMLFVHNGNFF